MNGILKSLLVSTELRIQFCFSFSFSWPYSFNDIVLKAQL
jgi:hypothetical protein